MSMTSDLRDRTVNSALPYKRSGLAIFASVFLGVLMGITYSLGKSSHPEFAFRLAGVGLLCASSIVLFVTVRRWAGYFFALSVFIALKLAFALVFGVTVSVPRLKTDYPVVSQLFLMVLVMAFLTYRFIDRAPRSKLDALSLIGGVIGIALNIVLEPNMGRVKSRV